MAHSCPDCGVTCYCNGDIDDILFGDDSAESEGCNHFLSPTCEGYEEEDDSAEDWCGIEEDF